MLLELCIPFSVLFQLSWPWNQPPRQSTVPRLQTCLHLGRSKLSCVPAVFSPRPSSIGGGGGPLALTLLICTGCGLSPLK